MDYESRKLEKHPAGKRLGKSAIVVNPFTFERRC